MAVYRHIHITFWQDSFVLDLTPEEKFFYIYLMTNSKTTQCGIYELPKQIIELETGYNSDTVGKLIQKFTDYGKILYSDNTKEIMLLNWLKYNYSNSPKVIECIIKELGEVKEVEFLKVFDSVCKKYSYSIDTVSIQYKYSGGKNKNKNKNKNNIYISHSCEDKNIDIDIKKEKTDIPSLINLLFTEFYNLYPHKVSRKAAEEKYKKILGAEKAADKIKAKAQAILAGLKKYVELWKCEKREKQFIPHPVTWLNQERWTDEVEIPLQDNDNVSNKKSRYTDL